MVTSLFKIISNENIARNTFKMTLSGDTSGIPAPGQFINIKIDGLYLRRPMSVCDYAKDSLTVIYKVIGKGSEMLSNMKPGQKLDTLTGLGNGFDIKKSGNTPLLIGGGCGVPPLYHLAKKLKEKGCKITAVLGFDTKESVFFKEEMKTICDNVYVTTNDGSYGIKGFVTDVVKDIDCSFFYTCGPEPMLKAVYDNTKASGELSFEERMGCGFGACMGCSCETKYGSKRICKDGPVLTKEEIIW